MNKKLRILIPVLTTVIITIIAIVVVVLLWGLVPNNEWSGLIKAAITIFVILCALLAIAWSAYLTSVVRKSIDDWKPQNNKGQE
jgi:multisubunit Na+/H+ antiporter MnhB subunit